MERIVFIAQPKLTISHCCLIVLRVIDPYHLPPATVFYRFPWI
jgi:hypothetical protein